MFSYKPLKYHSIFWTCFILYELSVSYTFSGKFSSIFDYIGHYALNISLFYFNLWIVFAPNIGAGKKSYFGLVALFLLQLALYCCLKIGLYLLLDYTGVYKENNLHFNFRFFMESLWRAVFFIGMSTSYWVAVSMLEYRKKNAALERMRLESIINEKIMKEDLLKSENAFLKAQLNPHFLFNSLGFIYNKVFQSSEEAGETILLLTDMMRYVLSDSGTNYLVDLGLEIEHINNYLLINQYRFDERLSVNFSYPDGSDHFKIIPLLLVTLVENVMKYGDLFNPDRPADIRLQVQGGTLEMIIKNAKSKKGTNKGYGIGLANIRKRLEYHYPGHFSLDICDSDSEYELKLIITNAND